MKNLFQILAFVIFCLNFQSFAKADDSFKSFEEFRVMAYQKFPGSKPLPIKQFGDCTIGAISCPLQVTLEQIDSPPDFGTPTQPPPKPELDLIGKKSFSADVGDNKTFKAEISIRKREGMYSVNLVCTTPDGQTSMSSQVVKGDAADFKFAHVVCPTYNLPNGFFMDARLLISDQKETDYGYLRY